MKKFFYPTNNGVSSTATKFATKAVTPVWKSVIKYLVKISINF